MNLLEKKIGPIYKNSRNFYSKNISLSSQKYGLVSGIPRSIKAPDPGSVSETAEKGGLFAT
jgi:hypothetical protein